MAYLVYWYGAQRKDEYYSLIPQSNFIDYEDKEKQKKLKVPTAYPKNIQAKLDNGTSLSAADEDVVRPLREMFEDVGKKPEDRKRGDVDFLEAWDLITMQDVNDCLLEVDSSDKPGPNPKSSKAAPKKRKRAKDIKDEEETNEDVPKRRNSQSKGTKTNKKIQTQKGRDDPTPKRRIAKKKSKQAGKEEFVQMSQDEKTLKQCIQAFLPTIKTWSLLIKSKDVSHVIQHLENSVKDQMASYSPFFILQYGLQDLVIQTRFLFDEISPDDELAKSAQQFKCMFDKIMEVKESTENAEASESKSENEDDFVDDHVSSDEERAEDDFEPEPTQSDDKPRKKGSKKKDVEGKTKAVKKKKLVKHKIPTKASKNYKAMVNAWRSVLMSKDVYGVYRKIQEVQKGVNSYRRDSQFFSEMDRLLKDTRDLFKEDAESLPFLEDAKICLKSLKQTLRELYSENVKSGPTKKLAPRIVDAEDDSSERFKKAAFAKEDTKEKGIAGEVKKESSNGSIGTKGLTPNSIAPTSSKSLSPPRVSSQKVERKFFSLSSMIRSNSKSTKLAESSSESHDPQKPAQTASDDSVSVAAPGQNVDQKPSSLRNIVWSNSKPTGAVSETKSKVPCGAATIKPLPRSQDDIQQSPPWMNEIVYPPNPIDSQRQMAIDFLLDSKTMLQNAVLLLNFDAICLSIEAAVFDWSRDNFNKTDGVVHYWNRIHAIVAALSSTSLKGKSLIKRIAGKEIQQPKDILELDLESLTEAFEKVPMVAPNSDIQ